MLPSTPSLLELGAFLLMLNWARRQGWSYKDLFKHGLDFPARGWCISANGWRIPKGMKFPNLEMYASKFETLDAFAVLRALEYALQIKNSGQSAKTLQGLADEMLRAWLAIASFLMGEEPKTETDTISAPTFFRNRVSPKQKDFLRKQPRWNAALGVRSCVGWARFIS